MLKVTSHEMHSNGVVLMEAVGCVDFWWSFISFFVEKVLSQVVHRNECEAFVCSSSSILDIRTASQVSHAYVC